MAWKTAVTQNVDLEHGHKSFSQYDQWACDMCGKRSTLLRTTGTLRDRWNALFNSLTKLAWRNTLDSNGHIVFICTDCQKHPEGRQ